jgi:uncharacterized membrane protein
MKRILQLVPRVTAYSLIALIALCISWELWLAPLRPGGSWLALKAIPLFLPMRGILTGRRYTYKWTSLLALLYVCEGSVRFATDPGDSRWYALAELVLAITLFASAVATVRLSRKAPNPTTVSPRNAIN